MSKHDSMHNEQKHSDIEGFLHDITYFKQKNDIKLKT